MLGPTRTDVESEPWDHVAGDAATSSNGSIRAWTALALTVMLTGCASLSSSPADIEAVERARFAAMTRQDITSLERMLALDVLYCHSDGRCEDKAQFLATIEKGRVRYRDIRIENVRARPAAGAYILNGTVSVQGEQSGREVTLRLTYTDVYVRRDGAWQLAAWQSTRVP